MLIVGGGPAGLAAAIRLSQLRKQQGGGALAIAVIEKAREAGAHTLSGAVLDTSTLRDLIPDFLQRGAPLASAVREDRVFFLTQTGQIPFPIIPPPLRNHGNYIVSLSALVTWLAGQAEAEGVDIFTGFAGQDVLMDGARVIGVRTGDRGVNRHGEPKSTFEAGVDIKAQVTIFCDGVRGNLTKQLGHLVPLAPGAAPPQFAVGVKELWEVPKGRVAAGTVMHTLGYPLRQHEFGGAFIYAMPDGLISLGLVVGLDYKDPLFDPHAAFNRLKQHPFMRNLLEGGQMIRYGAKALPEGGWNTIPRIHMDGGLVAGDAAGFMNSMRLKGIHLAMRSGMLAGEAAFEAIRAGDTSAAGLARYQDKIDASPVRAELFPVRNVHQAFGYGLLPGVMFSGLALLTRGWWVSDLHGHPGHTRMQTIEDFYGRAGAPADATPIAPADRGLIFDKPTSVHFAGTAHEEDQPPHLHVQTDVCHTICGPEYGHPCIRFCPAHVYEVITDAGGSRLQINASNCVHCKTCDIMDPYQVITWVPPEGGGGPQYNGM